MQLGRGLVSLGDAAVVSGYFRREPANTLWKKSGSFTILNIDHSQALLGLAVPYLLNDRREIAMSGTLRDTCRASLEAAGKTYHYYSLAELAKTYPSLRKLPSSLRSKFSSKTFSENGSLRSDG